MNKTIGSFKVFIKNTNSKQVILCWERLRAGGERDDIG